MMNRLHFKTELCDGECHMTAYGFWEHRIKERRWQQLQKLRKLANNPALAKDVRDTIQRAIIDTNMANYWRQAYIELREKHEGKGE